MRRWPTTRRCPSCLVDRRQFITALRGVAVAPSIARAQATKVPEVGFLYGGNSAAGALGIAIHDHLVIDRKGHASFRSLGPL